MALRSSEPYLGADSFNCPRCGAFAHQRWYSVGLHAYANDERPQVPPKIPVEEQSLIKIQKLTGYTPKGPYRSEGPLEPADFRLGNTYSSFCYSCKQFTIWIEDKIIYPIEGFPVEINADLPRDIRDDLDEASKIVDISPRGAAALLRLSIQKICIHLGLPGKNLDQDIATLVQSGLETQVQRALDIVRVVGNEAVHPGTLDLRDNREITLQLFELVNLVAEATISRPKRIESMFSTLPASKLDAIAKRDATKSPEVGTLIENDRLSPE